MPSDPKLRVREKEGEMKDTVTIEEPRFAKWLFNSTHAAFIWLVVRVWIGYQWMHAGWEKITGTDGGWHFTMSSTSWLRSSAGLKGFAAYALTNTGKPHAAVNYGWYAAFLRWIEHSGAGVLAPVIALGEFAIGLGLIVGLFTGVAAFSAGLLTVSFGLSGSAGVNPLFFVIEVGLILAWRNAGYYGLDGLALPFLGTPWRPGKLFGHRKEPELQAVA
jgi:thiosulfate dehydrogenase (quinone) large subunit